MTLTILIRRTRSHCCARAASAHATAAPPNAASNSRRLMVTVIRPSRARCVKKRYHVTSVQSCRFKEAGCWLLSSGCGSKAERLSFSLCPRKRTYLPILELLPPPAFRECRHRGLARRLITVGRRAVLMVAKGERPQPRVPSGDAALHDAAQEADARGGNAKTWRLVAASPTLPNVLIFGAAMGAV